jgi:hypothetical protein
MLLGFIVSECGIEANPKKISTITKMSPIQDMKGIQMVMGYLAALSHFISCLDEKVLPLYHLLKKETLTKLKVTLSNPPILIPLAIGEPLLLYVAVTTQVVSTTIVIERVEEGHALPI